MADERRAAARAERAELEARIAQIERRLGQRESEAAGELADVDQHPADLGTETYDRERDLQRLEEFREELRALDDAIENPHDVPVPAGERLAVDPDDDRTPLDAVEPDPVDLAAIPMGRDETIDKDPQDLDSPGMVYWEGSGEADVGDRDDVELDGERFYRPET